MKIINILSLIFLLQFSACSIAEESDSYVSNLLVDYGYGLTENKQIIRWMFFDVSSKNSCFDIELIDAIELIKEDKLGICELYVEDLDQTVNFKDDVSTYGIYDISIGESYVKFSAKILLLELPLYYRELDCEVAIKDKKIQPVECTTVAFDIPDE